MSDTLGLFMATYFWQVSTDVLRRIDEWRDSHARQIARLQGARVLRADLEPTDVLRSLGALALGAGTRMLGNASPHAVEQELRMLDGFIDALADPSGLRSLG